jgi:small subunit ribosomal protein S13
LVFINEKSGLMGSRRVKEAGKKEEKPKEEKKKELPKDKKVRKRHEGIREIVRISEVNLDGNKKLGVVLLGVKGIGKSLARNIVVASGLDPDSLLGSITEEQIKKLEDAINDPSKYGVPRYMINRRSEPATGEDQHLVSSKLRFALKSDVDFMRKIRSYKGIRHELGLPVRGQRTRTSFRGGKAVGVSKSKEARNVARKEASETAGAKPAVPAKEEKK